MNSTNKLTRLQSKHKSYPAGEKNARLIYGKPAYCTSIHSVNSYVVSMGHPTEKSQIPTLTSWGLGSAEVTPGGLRLHYGLPDRRVVSQGGM